jgi:aldehyde:ferredoxin oxidoreductase
MDHLKHLAPEPPSRETIKEALGLDVERLSVPQFNVWCENRHAIVDSLGLCKYEGVILFPQRLEHFRDLLAAATGWSVTLAELYRCGDRIYNIEKAFNVREGLTRKDDLPPRRFITEKASGGPINGLRIDERSFNKLLEEYYEARGWNIETGIPTREKLEEVELKYIADDLDELQNSGKIGAKTEFVAA